MTTAARKRSAFASPSPSLPLCLSFSELGKGQQRPRVPEQEAALSLSRALSPASGTPRTPVQSPFTRGVPPVTCASQIFSAPRPSSTTMIPLSSIPQQLDAPPASKYYVVRVGPWIKEFLARGHESNSTLVTRHTGATVEARLGSLGPRAANDFLHVDENVEWARGTEN